MWIKHMLDGCGWAQLDTISSNTLHNQHVFKGRYILLIYHVDFQPVCKGLVCVGPVCAEEQLVIYAASWNVC